MYHVAIIEDDLPTSNQLCGWINAAKDGVTVDQWFNRDDAEASNQEAAPSWLLHLIEWLPVPEQADTLALSDTGSYQVQRTGNPATVDSYLASVALRVSGYVAAMLLAIVLAWLLIEWRFLRRVSQLTQPAAVVSYNVQGYHQHDLQQHLSTLDLSDLRDKDELGILASSLADLLQRVKDDVQREQIRAQQERDMWHAVGHEILSPLQSLMVLHPDTADSSFRYIQRMQQAVRIRYGSTPPSEALQAISLQLNNLNLVQFLQHIADNAEFAGINKVPFDAPPQEITVLADEFSLEDVLTHILRNADRYRAPESPIRISVGSQEQVASVCIHNQGSSIAPALLDKIFEYGVSDPNQSNPENRGQGLFVAKTYMAKMGGTIHALNVVDGVKFTLELHVAR